MSNTSPSFTQSQSVQPVRISPARWFSTYLRLFAVQGSWNYESMLGTGIAFSAEPLTALVPNERRNAARARQAQYFNSHPYLAGVAVGALARAELEGQDPARIERFRKALCVPLGSVGDQIIWAGWLPFSALFALGVYGLGAGPLLTVVAFLVVYNSVHLVLRAWGLQIGLSRGLQVASALNSDTLRKAPEITARMAAFVAGAAIPLTLHRLIEADYSNGSLIIGASLIGAVLFIIMQSKIHGWQLASIVMALFMLTAVIG